jgi:hypothetical protein
MSANPRAHLNKFCLSVANEESTMQLKNALLSAAALTLLVPFNLKADNGVYSGSGGSFSTGYAAGQYISVQGLPLAGTTATLSFNCPITFYGAGTYALNWSCAGGSVTISSSDNSLIMHGYFTSGSMNFSGGGGGRGGHVSYWYSFNGKVAGTVTAAGITQHAYGSISQSVHTTSQIGAGSAPVTSATFGWNSAYSPVLVADLTHSRILGADNIQWSNAVAYGSSGSGVGQFQTIAGLAQDATRRIYATDSALNRLVRINDLTGADWVQFGSSGSGANQFNGPTGVTIDSAGKIWVADSGNNRIVRFDDMTGKNWTAFGTLGTGANQFSAPNSIAFDAQGRIYVTDSGNARLVRFDDLTGKNWTSISQLSIDPYGYPISSPIGVHILTSGQIQVALTYGNILTMSDMTGANGSATSWGSTLYGMSVDNSGTTYVTGSFSAGLAQAVDAAGAGYFTAPSGSITFQPGPVLAEASSSPTPAAPVISTTSLSFATRNVGEPGTATQVTITNIGATSMPISSVTASPDFKLTNPCPAALGGGGSCKISVQFDPTTTGARMGTLSIETESVHPVLNVKLKGTGTMPSAVVLPGALSFLPQQTSVASGAQSVTLSNTGTGPLTISSIVATGDFSQTSDCPAQVPPGNGCTIGVVFKPTATGTRTGVLTISDDAIPAGTQQTVALIGTGSATAPAFTLSPESLYFPDQETATVSLAQTVTLKNNSGATASFTAPVYPAAFKGTTTCGASLAAGASCAFHIQFAPTATGPVFGSVSIPITGMPALGLAVSGTGTPSTYAAALSFNPPSLDFGALQTGDNPSMSLTITNTSGLPTGVQSIGLTGSGAFTLTGNTCPAVLAGGKTCTLKVTFQPQITAIYSGNLKIVESSGATTNVGLSGSATVNGS